MGKQLLNMEDTNKQKGQTTENQTASFSVSRKLIFRKLKLKKFNPIQKKERFSKKQLNGELAQIVSDLTLQCPICMDLLVFPCMMLCGHLYCSKCLDINISLNQGCCLCRKEQEDNYLPIPSKLAETLINSLLVTKDSDHLKYLCRINESKQWIKRRRSINVNVGSVVDVKDQFNIWRKGLVTRILNNNREYNIIQVQIKINGENFLEKVEVNCNRLAPYTFFTKRRYMDDFTTIILSKEESLEEKTNICNQNQSINKSFLIGGNDGEDSEQLSEDLQSYIEESLIINSFDVSQSELIWN